jgi:hypothetical protein
MKVEIGGQTYHFYFRYAEVAKTFHVGSHQEAVYTCRATTCVIERPDRVGFTGTAVCSPHDHFVRERGRKLALARALSKAQSQDAIFRKKEIREQIWWAYLGRRIYDTRAPYGWGRP